MKQLIVTLIGKDRPGLVELVSNTVLQHQGSWQASNFSNLSGQFAGILHIAVPTQQVKELCKALDDISELHIHFVEANSTLSSHKTYQLTITGNDRPGIVSEVTTKLASMSVNIHKLKTTTQGAPNSGHSLFVASFELDLPTSVDLDQVQGALEALADDLTIDIED
ncbi:amino acid-binding protein [Vibrio sp. Of7-15]|uniref:glycine cleavage system protein R n=1 Tax=Vibrio sp. Of7-15 TaxID=2724879 RepID=UPI001EF19AAD|nr:ACT domain-containing protein [Vibrio sp. Of7-15]MCG7498572.1 amino acid-binding protein [Vibrio sp. Of7-15]